MCLISIFCTYMCCEEDSQSSSQRVHVLTVGPHGWTMKRKMTASYRLRMLFPNTNTNPSRHDEIAIQTCDTSTCARIVLLQIHVSDAEGKHVTNRIRSGHAYRNPC